jgi:hypothetical protein
LAKFKKKRSKPTGGPEDSKKKIRDTAADKPADDADSTPPTEKIDASPPEEIRVPPPMRSKKGHIVSVAEAAETKRKMDRLFWMRVALSVIAGASATFLFESIEDVEEKRWTSIGFMIAVFIMSVIIAKGMKIRLHSGRKKLITNGLGSFVFLYLFVWIVTYTLVNSGSGGFVTPVI